MTHRRTVVATVALAVLATLGGCMGALTTGTASGQVDNANGTASIQVSATGQVEAEPDQAILRVAVVATGEDATTARDRLASDVSQMRDALRDAGIADDQVRTAYFDLRPQYDRTPTTEDREPTGYQATQSFEITLTDVSRAGEIIDVAVNNGANRIDGVSFTLADETQRELRDDALREALTNARADADTLADASDLAIVGVQSVSTGEGGFVPYRAEYATAEAADGATSLEPGPVTVTASVSVTYNATATTA